MWKRKSTYLIIILVMILTGIIMFINIVHIPYLNHKNNLDQIEETIIEQDHLKNIEIFQEYNSDETYYIVITDQKAYVYNENLERIYRKRLKSLEIDAVESMDFDDQYSYITGQYGYENDRLCYLFKLDNGSKVEYRYYNLENSQLIKMYILK